MKDDIFSRYPMNSGQANAVKLRPRLGGGVEGQTRVQGIDKGCTRVVQGINKGTSRSQYRITTGAIPKQHHRLRRAYPIEALGVVRGLRVSELEVAGGDFCHGAELAPVG